MSKSKIIILAIILAFFGLGIYLFFYPQMPNKMASHWNAKGMVEDYTSKFWGLFLMPIISLGLFLLFIFVPKIDPLKENIEKFRRYFDSFTVLLFLFLFYFYLLTIFWNLGIRFSIPQFLSPVCAILFYYCGILTENIKRNWFIGIKTPWTLSNDMVWEKTHRISGKLFKISGIICFLGTIFPDYAILFIISPVILAAVYPAIYSYFEYQKYQK